MAELPGPDNGFSQRPQAKLFTSRLRFDTVLPEADVQFTPSSGLDPAAVAHAISLEPHEPAAGIGSPNAGKKPLSPPTSVVSSPVLLEGSWSPTLSNMAAGGTNKDDLPVEKAAEGSQRRGRERRYRPRRQAGAGDGGRRKPPGRGIGAAEEPDNPSNTTNSEGRSADGGDKRESPKPDKNEVDLAYDYAKEHGAENDLTAIEKYLRTPPSERGTTPSAFDNRELFVRHDALGGESILSLLRRGIEEGMARTVQNESGNTQQRNTRRVPRIREALLHRYTSPGDNLGKETVLVLLREGIENNMARASEPERTTATVTQEPVTMHQGETVVVSTARTRGINNRRGKKLYETWKIKNALLDRYEAILAAREQGRTGVISSLSDVARTLGVHNQRVSDVEGWLAERGFAEVPEKKLLIPPRSPSYDKAAAYLNRRLRGRKPEDRPLEINATAVIKHLGIGYSALYDAMEGKSVVIAKGAKRRKTEEALIDRNKRVIEAREHGLRGVIEPVSEIARRLGVSPSYAIDIASQMTAAGELTAPEAALLIKADTTPHNPHTGPRHPRRAEIEAEAALIKAGLSSGLPDTYPTERELADKYGASPFLVHTVFEEVGITGRKPIRPESPESKLLRERLTPIREALDRGEEVHVPTGDELVAELGVSKALANKTKAKMGLGRKKG